MYIIYIGKSEISKRHRIMAIITGVRRKSKNPKTGTMAQVYILPVNGKVRPTTAICPADCKFHDAAGNPTGCYVGWHHGPSKIRKAYKAGKYILDSSLEKTRDDLRRTGRNVRIGAAGDPAAVPFYVWERLLTKDKDGWFPEHTAYTHDWRNGRSQKLASIAQASVESEEDAALALAAGWSYFRVRAPGTPRAKKELDCPATGVITTQCNVCMACNGFRVRGVSLVVHGYQLKKAEAVVTR